MKTDRIHFGYILSFLLIVILSLITIKWGSIKELTNYITFALTLTSLVLAVLAIVYSFFSNSSMTRNISNLEDASKKISTNSDLLNSAADKLDQKLCDIPSSLKNIELKTDNTFKAFEEFSKKGLATHTMKNSIENNPKNNSLQKQLCYKGSINTTSMLLALKLAYENQIDFNLDDILSNTKMSNEAYLQGFLVTAGAMDIYKYDSEEIPKKNSNWRITYLDQEIIDNIEDATKYYIDEFGHNEDMEFISENFESIRKYFKN